MRRAYNEKLSPSINAQLARRAHVIALQKRLIAFFAILIVSLMILLAKIQLFELHAVPQDLEAVDYCTVIIFFISNSSFKNKYFYFCIQE